MELLISADEILLNIEDFKSPDKMAEKHLMF